MICEYSRTSRLHNGNCIPLAITTHEGSEIMWPTVTCNCHKVLSCVLIVIVSCYEGTSGTNASFGLEHFCFAPKGFLLL